MVDQNRDGYEFNSVELQTLTGWPDQVVEDYLNLRRSIQGAVSATNNEIIIIEGDVEKVNQQVGGADPATRARVVLLKKQVTDMQNLLDGVLSLAFSEVAANKVRGQVIKNERDLHSQIAARVSLGN